MAVNVWTDLEKRYATTHYHACERPTDEIELSAVGHTPRAPGASERRAFAAVVLLRSIRCAHLCVTEYRPRTATLYHTGHPRSWTPSCLTDSLLSRLIRARDSNSWPMPAHRSRRAFFLPSMRACVRRGFGRPFPTALVLPERAYVIVPLKTPTLVRPERQAERAAAATIVRPTTSRAVSPDTPDRPIRGKSGAWFGKLRCVRPSKKMRI